MTSPALLGDPRLPARFWAKVNIAANGCWLWTASTTEHGYGRFSVGRSSWRVAHRVAYDTLVAPIPADLQADHLCRNRACVNPGHLEAVTPRENVMRGVGPSAVNAAKPGCPAGHPYDENNTYTYVVDGKVRSRNCRECHRIKQESQRSPKSDWTHCKRGHEYTPENTYIVPSRGARACRACNREAAVRYAARRRAEAVAS